MTIPVPKPRLTGYLTPPKLGLMKISSAYVKNCSLFGFIASKIGFAENFLPPNLGDYEVACHTSEAPGLPALQGRLPSPQDGRVAIRLLPLAGLLLRRADMMDKGFHIMDTLPLFAPPAPCCSGCP